MQEFASDVYDNARHISRWLSAAGYKDEANEIDRIMRVFWTTSSEALGEIKASLLRARSNVVRSSDNIQLLNSIDETINLVTRLFNDVQGSA